MTTFNLLGRAVLVVALGLTSISAQSAAQFAQDIQGLPNGTEKLGKNMDWSERYSVIDAAGFAYLSYAVAVDAYAPAMTVSDQERRFTRSLEIAGFKALPKSLFIASWKEMDFFAFATTSAVVIVFRGTEDPKVEFANIRDWFTDGAIQLNRFNGFSGRLHTGFHDSYTEGEHLINTYLRGHKNKPIYVTGHSLGGRIGTITTLLLLSQKYGARLFSIQKSGEAVIPDLSYA